MTDRGVLAYRAPMAHDLEVAAWSMQDLDQADPRKVLVLPGARYSAREPGLSWPTRALALGGWHVWVASWDMPMSQPRDERQAVVDAALDLFVQLADAVPDLVLSKSVGTLAAGWVADHDVPAVWTTPLLDDPGCVRDIARSHAPALLVAGDRDFTWDDDGARRSGKDVVRVPGADHGWQTGDWHTELAAVEEVTSAVERFADALAHPPSAEDASPLAAGEAS
jgi:hypothetical protein